MTILDRIKELSKKRDKTVKDVAIELGLGENYLYSLKSKVPNGQTLQKLADYFHVSVDYLLGREDMVDDGIKNPEVRILARQMDNEFDAEQIAEFQSFAQYLRHKKFGDKKDGKI